MTEVTQTGWTRVLTRTGRYEYQFQGRVPAVRNGQYEDAGDYQFLLMDEEGWLYRIPVRLAAAAEAEARMTDDSGPTPPASEQDSAARQPGARAAPVVTATQIAEAQLRKGLENYRPRQNAPYAELDGYFAVDAARARRIAAGDL